MEEGGAHNACNSAVRRKCRKWKLVDCDVSYETGQKLGRRRGGRLETLQDLGFVKVKVRCWEDE